VVPVRTIHDDERLARLGIRHRLAIPASSVTEAATSLVGLHSSDPTTVYLSARARVSDFRHRDLEEALYDERSLVRMLGMRRTLWVIPRDLAAAMNEACTRDLVPPERRRLLTALEDQAIATDREAWLSDVCAHTLAVLEELGEAPATVLREHVQELGLKLRFGEGTTWATEVGVSTRVLFLLATEARVVRARPLGGWTSGQYRWAPLDRWLGAPLDRVERAAAARELLRRWLAAFGPATETDIRWWTGWTAKLARATLADLSVAEVRLDHGGTGYVLSDDLDVVSSPDPWVALLPSLDPTVMGWKEREWYLGPHTPRLFDRNGNAGPTVMADGRIVGGWGHTKTGEVAIHLLEDVGAETRAAVDAEADRLATWLAGVWLRPRFRTPLDRALSDP
jgi:hypothetical protein